MSARRHRVTIERARTERVALEAEPARARVAHAYRRHVEPIPILRLAPDWRTAADELRAEGLGLMRQRIDRCMRAGMLAYLFVDPNLDAYVLAETHPAVERWCADRAASFVGVYGSSRGRGYARLAEDIDSHLEEIQP